MNGYPIRDYYRSCYRRAIEYYTKASAFSRTKRDSARLCIQLAHTYMLLVPRMYERETQVGLMCKSMGYMGQCFDMTRDFDQKINDDLEC